MIPEILILIIGLFILIKTSKWVIEYAVRFSDITGLSHGTTGFLLLAVATSLPELSISIISIFNDSSRIAAGTLFGANIIDIGVVFGITALISGFKIIKKDFDQISHAIIITSIIAVFALVLGTMNIVFGIFCIIMFVVSIKAVLEGGREFEEKEEKNVLVNSSSLILSCCNKSGRITGWLFSSIKPIFHSGIASPVWVSTGEYETRVSTPCASNRI